MSGQIISGIKGGCGEYCKPTGILLDSIEEQRRRFIQAEDETERTGLFHLIDQPSDDLIPEVEEHLRETPCKFVETGECEIAVYAIKNLAGL